MKRFKKYDPTLIGYALLCAGLLWWFAETCWFGWHRLPQSSAERWCDRATIGLFMSGYLIGWKVVPRSKGGGE